MPPLAPERGAVGGGDTDDGHARAVGGGVTESSGVAPEPPWGEECAHDSPSNVFMSFPWEGGDPLQANDP